MATILPVVDNSKLLDLVRSVVLGSKQKTEKNVEGIERY